MEYEERICTTQGKYIVASGIDFEEILEKKPIELISGKINTGEYTTMHGWFDKPCRFVGFLNTWAIFYLGGGQDDLFSAGGYYYDATAIFTSDRIGKSYRAGSFRDAFLRQKNNKYYWK